MGTNPLLELGKLGQSPWLDFIERGLILSGELLRMVSEEGITGVTSNPTIFEKAISGGKEYDKQVRALAEREAGVMEAYKEIVTEDIRNAADVLRPVYDATSGTDGFVSLEVDPDLAYDTERTVARAEELFRAVSRRNVLIKIPGTREGLPAIEETVARGIPVNVTLIFSVRRYEEVAEAYLRGLERIADQGKNPGRVASVASFFVSRVDTAVDRMLDEVILRWPGSPKAETAISLKGRVAVANARLAYARFGEIFSTPRWKALVEKGAKVQRPLWASTGTKNPKYSDVLYVEELIGPHTVNTMPLATIDAFRDHGKVADTLTGRGNEAKEVLDDLGLLDIGIEEVCETLVRDGVQSFTDSYQKLLEAIERKLSEERVT
ncbi:MAG TPA: transaldolase [Candidatus Deferrimicrobiaceae bacterium]|nr:transaldolase [Candidatus Deferrimicrobiaceae bacterium]